MSRKRAMLSTVTGLICVVMLMVLAACSCSKPVQTSSRSEETLEANEVAEAGVAETEPFYVAIIGEDTRKGTAYETDPMYADGSSRSDTTMIVRADPTTYQVTFVTIPRDTRDTRFDGTPCKFNERYQFDGLEGCLDAIESLTGVTPKYYIDTTFVGFEDLVNDLGGITMNIPFDQSLVDIVSGNEMSYPAGEQELDGAEALIYARERHKYADVLGLPDMEAYRQSADRSILQTIVTKVLSDSATTSNVVEQLSGSVKTNWDLGDMKATAEDFAKHADQVTFLKGTGPYEGGIDPESQLWVTYRDEDVWRQIMDVVDQGGDPNEVLTAPSL